MIKKKIEKFCIFRNKKENTVKYVYNYYTLLYCPKSRVWVIIKQSELIEDCIEVLDFDNYGLIGEFRGYRIR